MTKKEIIGFIFIFAGVTIGPFAYWLNIKWAFLAIVLFAIGIGFCFYGKKDRELKELKDNDRIHPDVYLGKELKGFRGSDVFDDDDF